MTKKALFLSLFALISIAGIAQSNNKPYDYPIKPGSQAWNELGGTVERFTACQIPPDVVKDLTTSALVESCLDFPFLIGVFTSNDYQTGFRYLKTHFNGLEELFRRADVGKSSIDSYARLLSATISTSDENEFMKHFNQTLYLELILAQPETLQRLNAEELKTLRAVAIKHFERKQQYPVQLSNGTILSTSLVLGQILKLEGKSNNKALNEAKLDRFCDKVEYTDDRIIYDIYEISKNL